MPVESRDRLDQALGPMFRLGPEIGRGGDGTRVSRHRLAAQQVRGGEAVAPPS